MTICKRKIYILLIFLFNVVKISAPISWAPASMGYCDNNNLVASSTMLTVPVTYDPDAGETKIFVKRYITKGNNFVNQHLIMLPGGPGQSEDVLEGHVANIEQFIKKGIAFYLTDIRGSGQSLPVVSPLAQDWFLKADTVAQNSPIPLPAIYLSNAAKDVIRLAKEIRQSPEFKQGSELYLYGVSFGATWAHRILSLDTEGLFSRVIFDSIAPLDGIVSPEGDEGLLRNCDSHPYCKAHFGGDAKNARKMANEILNPERNNQCTKQLNALLNDGNKFHQDFTPMYRLYMLLQPSMEGSPYLGYRLHSTQLVLAFIYNAHKCENPVAFSDILKTMEQLESSGGSTGSFPSIFATAGNRKITASAGGGDINWLVNHSLFIGEAYDWPNRGNGNCGLETLSHHCLLYFHYENIYKLTKNYILPRPVNANSGFSTKALIFFVHGQLDMHTPVAASTRFVKKISGSIREIVYRNRGHALVSDGECASVIWREVFGIGSSSDTDKCMQAANSVPLDWTMREAPKYKDWWDRNIPITYFADPVIPSGGLSTSTIIIICAVVFLLLSGGVVGFILYRKGKFRFNKKD